MKFRDIEKKLRREQDGVNVPDVYARVSGAPLNKLLEGETPARAFRKKMATGLLALTLVLFLVLAIGLSAMWLSPDRGKTAPDCYASVSVENGGEITTVGVVFGGRNILVCVIEGEVPIVSHSSQISDLIQPKSGDKVSIEIISTKNASVADIARIVAHEVETAYKGVDYTVSTSANLKTARDRVSAYVSAHGGSVDEGAGAKEIVDAYSNLFLYSSKTE